MTNKRERLRQEYLAASFAALDVGLFLDTHPHDAEALACHKHYTKVVKTLTCPYEEEFGPLTSSAVQGNNWAWIAGPWPWQKEWEV